MRPERVYGRGSTEAAALIAAVKQAGYEVASKEWDLIIQGMTCASCVARVERALRAVPGVMEVKVSVSHSMHKKT